MCFTVGYGSRTRAPRRRRPCRGASGLPLGQPHLPRAPSRCAAQVCRYDGKPGMRSGGRQRQVLERCGCQRLRIASTERRLQVRLVFRYGLRLAWISLRACLKGHQPKGETTSRATWTDSKLECTLLEGLYKHQDYRSAAIRSCPSHGPLPYSLPVIQCLHLQDCP